MFCKELHALAKQLSSDSPAEAIVVPNPGSGHSELTVCQEAVLNLIRHPEVGNQLMH